MSNIDLVVVGSIGIDSIKTQTDEAPDVLGGSVSYACAAAAYFGSAGMVGVVGTDFPEAHMNTYRKCGIDLEGLQQVEGKTFRWSGEYEANMNNRNTLSTDLNVLADFKPELPELYRESPFLFLANIQPDLQSHVLAEMHHPEFVVADTMDLWINIARDDLVTLIGEIDMLMLNDSEAALLTGEDDLGAAAKAIMQMGPHYVIVKKGEHGAELFWEDLHFDVPAYKLEKVVDPTGAGDSFAGGFMGSVAKSGKADIETVKRAMLYGTVLASFTCEAFSVDRLVSLTQEDIEARLEELKSRIG